MATKAEFLGRYAEGWTKGDVSTIFKAVAPEFILDDPNSGKVHHLAFETYFKKLKEAVGKNGPTFMDISEVLTQEKDGFLVASCWWAIQGTNLQGSGLIKVGNFGVVSEKIAYYTKVPLVGGSFSGGWGR